MHRLLSIKFIHGITMRKSEEKMNVHLIKKKKTWVFSASIRIEYSSAKKNGNGATFSKKKCNGATDKNTIYGFENENTVYKLSERENKKDRPSTRAVQKDEQKRKL